MIVTLTDYDGSLSIVFVVCSSVTWGNAIRWICVDELHFVVKGLKVSLFCRKAGFNRENSWTFATKQVWHHWYHIFWITCFTVISSHFIFIFHFHTVWKYSRVIYRVCFSCLWQTFGRSWLYVRRKDGRPAAWAKTLTDQNCQAPRRLTQPSLLHPPNPLAHLSRPPLPASDEVNILLRTIITSLIHEYTKFVWAYLVFTCSCVLF